MLDADINDDDDDDYDDNNNNNNNINNNNKATLYRSAEIQRHLHASFGSDVDPNL